MLCAVRCRGRARRPGDRHRRCCRTRDSARCTTPCHRCTRRHRAVPSPRCSGRPCRSSRRGPRACAPGDRCSRRTGTSTAYPDASRTRIVASVDSGTVRFERQQTRSATVPRTGSAGAGRSPSIWYTVRSGGGPLCSASAPTVPSHDSNPMRRASAVQPGPLREAREPVQRAQRAGSRQDSSERERLAPRIPLLRVELLARAADDMARGDSRRACGDAVVARQAGRERSVRDVAELELSLDRVTDQRDAPASGLPLDRIDHVCRAGRLAQRAFVALARRLVDVGKEAGGRDGGAGHWAGIVDEIANHSTITMSDADLGSMVRDRDP